MTFKEFEKVFKTNIINWNKDRNVILTKRYVTYKFVFGGTWKNVEEYSVYYMKSFLGLFKYFGRYTNSNPNKVFEKFEKLSN